MAPRRDRELILRIARLRFEERLAQREIARRLGLSDATVSRALKQAFELDLVETIVRADPDRHPALERALVSRFGLAQAVVADAAGPVAGTLEAMGHAVAAAIAPSLDDGVTIGVGDGESASAVARNLPRLWLRNVEVVPLIGGVGQLHLASHPSEIARECAGRLHGRAWQVPAPAVMPDASAAGQVRQAPAVADAFAAMRRCALAVVGIGPIDGRTSMVRHGALKLSELESIAGLGAAGMICARAFDPQGRHLSSDLDGRTLAISFEDFRKIPDRWVIGAGPDKVAALRAAFKGGLATACGTDQPTARSLLDL